MSAVASAVDAVVVGAVDVGEASRIVRFLAADRGRFSAAAPGARASRKRFGGLLEIGNRLTIELAHGRGELPRISVADRVSGPRKARATLGGIALLAYGCELVSGLAPEGGPAERHFGLLLAWLERLEGPTLPLGLARQALEAKALTVSGLAPVLTRCAACGDPPDEPMVFDFVAGGAQHGRCGGGRPVSLDVLRRWEVARRTPLAEIDDTPAIGSEWLFSSFAEHQLGRALRSRVLLEDVG